MDRNETEETHGLETGERHNVTSQDDDVDVRALATSFIMYKVAEGLNKYYMMIIVPPGVIGNILSFLVMIQPHNRHMSFSLYICVLAVTDTISLLIGFTRFLNEVYEVDFPPSQYWYCKYSITILMMSTICSTLFIVNMTFDRFYSIIRPHKAASFNTVKRAKITVVVCIIFSILYNSAHFYVTDSAGRSCVPFGIGLETGAGKFYYWFSLNFNFTLPFVLLLIMNSFIIHAISSRSKLQNASMSKSRSGQGQSEGQGSKMKNTERQIYIMLLCVTFGFLILMAPSCLLPVYYMFVDYTKTPHSFAAFKIFHSVSSKAYYTNYAINFFLYVISGKKFRTDLVNLAKCANKGKRSDSSLSTLSQASTRISTISAMRDSSKQADEKL